MALTAVYRTGRAARIDRTDWSGVAGPVGAIARRIGAVSTVASPIVVEGQLWGCVTVTGRAALPLDTEDRLANFTELVGTAIANAESRARVRRLADEQAALRRVATLVAEAAPPSAVFGAVASEAGALFGADFSGMLRIEDATTVRTVADLGGHRRSPGGTRALDHRARRPHDAARGRRRGDACRGLGEHPWRDRASAA